MAVAMGYVFFLRMLSEYFKQFKRCRLVIYEAAIKYGPISRKAQKGPQWLTRRCTCKTEPLLCAHRWAEVLEYISS